MKKTLLVLSVLAACALVACGGGGSAKYVNNKVLGKFPSVYMELHKQMEADKADWQEDMQKAKKESDLMKIRDKYVAIEEKRKTDAEEMATKEFEKIKGSEVPFTMEYDDPNFEIRSATIAEATPSTGALEINLKVVAKQDVHLSMMGGLYYLVMGEQENTYLFKGTINPFVGIQIISNRTFPTTPLISAGQLCNEEGSKLMLYCNSYDFTTFTKIIFVDALTFNSAR